MFFKNAQIYRLPPRWEMSAQTLAKDLESMPFKPCSAMDLDSSGFVSPCPHASHGLVHSVGGNWLICLQIEQKLLPASVVRQEAAQRAAQIEAQQGFRPGRKQMREIKEAVTAELLPRAFSRTRSVRAFIDPFRGWLAVDASSRGAAELVIEALCRAADAFPVSLLKTEKSAGAVMTDWLAGGSPMFGFAIGRDCVLGSAEGETSSVRYTRHGLDGEDVRDHIAAGKRVASLALSYLDGLAFVLTDRLEVKRLQLLDVMSNDGRDDDDEAILFDCDFALMACELSKMFGDLAKALGGEV